MKYLAFGGLAALAACQPSTAKDGQELQVPQKTAVVAPTHSDCQEMPWNSAKSNCEASYEAEAAESAIEPAYQTLLGLMDVADRKWIGQKAHVSNGEPTYREALTQSQAAWVRFRDAQCQIERYEWRGGASADQGEAICSLRMNRERLAQLKQMQREYK